jgi:hypothetical protein
MDRPNVRWYCWSHRGVHLGAGETLVALIDLVSSLFLPREKLDILTSRCSAAQAADGYTRAETAAVLASQESVAFHLVLPGFI